MGTATATPASSGALTTEQITYRRYVKLGTNAEGKTTVDEQRILAETAAKDKDTGLSVNWAKAEKDGLTLFNENVFTTYQVKSLDGFKTLVPDEAQQLYLIQIGLDSIQTARANGLMKAMKEGAGEPAPEFDQQNVDLRSGVDEEGNYSLNKAPSRKSLSDLDKLIKLLTSLGVEGPQLETVLASYAVAKSESADVEAASAEVAAAQ